MTNVVAILQARMTSTRLPGKVLMDIAGEPMIVQQLRRLRQSAAVSNIVVATTVNAADDEVVDVALSEGVHVHRGSESDVLGRYYDAARESDADVVVRLTADCPLTDPGVVDRVVAALLDGADYASNVVERTFPIGLDVEALGFPTLEQVHELGTSPQAREHVTWFLLRERPERFDLVSVTDNVDNSDLRWTVDNAGDLDLVRRLYEDLSLANSLLPYARIIEYVREHPELATANVPSS
jgi:spore coat polysaccharide biosynthesis protein SpsF